MTHSTERYDRIFREGQDACARGKSNIDNPYTDDGDQEAWNEGWFDRCDADAEAAENGMGWDF
jgi:ribosome modulation factor